MTIAEELTQLASRVDANLEENIDLEDVAGAIRAPAEKCAGKLLAKPVCGRDSNGTLFVWVRERVETAATHHEAIAGLQAVFDAPAPPSPSALKTGEES